ncbi:MAG: hypothetical protein M3Y72_26620 [Acidobacteriota bacterium]|nr:hypothetical protein [Acidobacteriota bacterium]
MSSRRAFSQMLLANAFGRWLYAREHPASPRGTNTTCVFIGLNNNQEGRLAIGALVCTQFLTHQRSIHNLRQQYRYHSRLLYRSTDKFRIPFVDALIDYFVREKDLAFVAHLFSGYDRPDFEQPVSLEQRLLRQHFAAVLKHTLTRHKITASEPVVIHFRGLGAGRVDNLELVRHLRSEIPKSQVFSDTWNRQLGYQIGKAGHRWPAPNNLAQLGGFLCGSVAALSHPPEDKSKLHLLQALTTKLGGGKEPSAASFRNNLKFTLLERTY